MHTNHRLAKMSFGWHKEEVFETSTLDCAVLYVPVPNWWVGWKPSHLLLVLLPFFFPYHLGPKLCGSVADKALI